MCILIMGVSTSSYSSYSTIPTWTKSRETHKKVLDAIDEFGRTRKYLMNIGEYKSKTVVDLIKDRKPQVMVELGGYVGYSAIAFAAALRECGGSVYYSLEKSPEFGKVIVNLTDLAGLGNVIKVVVGSSSDSLRRLHADGALTQIDLLFLDHYKPLYTQYLKICEELGLIKVGTVLAADNVIKPGNPPYLEYVRSSVEKKNRDLAAISEPELKGNPNLIYESRLVEGWEPSGVPNKVRNEMNPDHWWTLDVAKNCSEANGGLAQTAPVAREPY
ncbi:hypothetical protein RRF57_012298 [Xylaria bambusicola]|uniref:catechol O-methyltransferase n=1 Tax=Xylaria bambusicola TaxID=326684 RepID=A0AAN7V1L1_9PEZI